MICDNDNKVDSNSDHNLVHYGVVHVYVYVYASYVVQLLLYNIQRSIVCNSINTTNYDNNTAKYDKIDSNRDHDCVHYGAVYSEL